MSRLPILLAAATILASGPMPLLAEDLGNGRSASVHPGYVARSGPPHIIWFYDGRDDTRDFPTNGFFPGDFAADPLSAAIGAAGLFPSPPSHPFNSVPQASTGSRYDDGDCAKRHRSYDPTSGTFVGFDHVRHRC
jgi:hypothetical protein